jgi:hypothetical protein
MDSDVFHFRQYPWPHVQVHTLLYITYYSTYIIKNSLFATNDDDDDDETENIFKVMNTAA